MKSVVTEAIKYSPGCIPHHRLDPLDAMAQTAYSSAGFRATGLLEWLASSIPLASGRSLRTN